MSIHILGVSFHNLTLQEAVDKGRALVDEPGFHYVVTPNPELVERAREDAAFAAALNGADLVLADGIGIVYAAKLLGKPLKGRCPGIDFASGLMAQLARDGKRLFLLGAKPGVAAAAAKNLEQTHPGLLICGTQDGYFQDAAAVAQQVRESGADVLFACLGAPKQEFFMVEHGEATGCALAIGLGGSLDVFSGEVRRAPRGWQKLGLEWLYRLLQNPGRIGRMAKLPVFLIRALRSRGKGGKS